VWIIHALNIAMKLVDIENVQLMINAISI